MKRTLAFLLTVVMVLSSFGMLSVVVAADEGTETPTFWTYSEGYAGQPAGTGTEDDPYQIATVDDLLWMAEIIGSAIVPDAEKNVTQANHGTGTPTDKVANPFAGEYCLQTKDIDLEGKIIPSIGYYTGNSAANAYRYNGTDKHRVFGGTYDGNGKKIYHGYISLGGVADQNNNAWGAGLFGVIYGATIKNVTLDNVSLYTKRAGTTTARRLSCAGLLVGVAVGGTVAKPDCNVIENCYVNNSCSIQCTWENDGRTANDQAMFYYRWGGLIGYATDTTIKNCINAADIIVQGCVGATGGLVGCMTSGVIENCVNTGNVTVVKTFTAKENGTRAYGGLVGLIPQMSPKYFSYEDTVAAEIGVKIKDSTNSGNIGVETFGSNASNVCYFGGIVGAALMLQKDTYSVTNSYNIGTLPTGNNTSKIGALVGCVSCDTNEQRFSLTDVYSTDLNGEQEDIYFNVDDSNDALIKSENYGTKDAKELDMLGLCQLYVQEKTGTAGTYRIVATINGSDWKKATFHVALTKDGKKSEVKDIEVDTCYTSMIADGKPVTDPSGRLFIAFVLTDVTEGMGYEISVSVTDDAENSYTSQIFTNNFG